MKNGWMYWMDKKVYIVLKNKRTYSGKVINVEINPPLIWITITDKFNARVMFSSGEIAEIKEEK